jgi:chromosome segregation ATPase
MQMQKTRISPDGEPEVHTYALPDGWKQLRNMKDEGLPLLQFVDTALVEMTTTIETQYIKTVNDEKERRKLDTEQATEKERRKLDTEQATEKQRAIDRLTQLETELTGEKQRAIDQETQLNTELTAEKQRATDLQTQLDAVNAQIRTNTTIIDDQNKRIDDLNAEKARLETESDELTQATLIMTKDAEENLVQARLDNTKQVTTINDLRRENNDLSATLKTLQDELLNTSAPQQIQVPVKPKTL